MHAFILGLISFMAVSQDAYRMISEERHDILASHIPNSKDLVLNSIRNNKRLIIYTEKEIPQAYQDWTGSLPGIHSPSYNISAAKPRERFGNPNVEFPWGSPAGTEMVAGKNINSFKFLLLPKDKRIEVKRKYLEGDRIKSFVWTFPTDTVVGEVLQIYHKETSYTFEVRTRRKGPDGGWKVAIYKPFSNLKEFSQFCSQNKVSLEHEEKEISQSHLIFKGEAMATNLKSIPESLVKKALSLDFVNVIGEEWHKESFAPTTDADFHIVPKNYSAATIALNSKSCVRCHESVLKHANEFDFRRDWYGRVRGSDGIFSFHPFEPSCISYGGIYQGAEIRKEFISNGIVNYEE